MKRNTRKILVLLAIVITLSAALLAGSMYFFKNDELSKAKCQEIVAGFKERGPLDELTAVDAKCMELLK